LNKLLPLQAEDFPPEEPDGGTPKVRIIDSQNHLGWKRPLRSSSPTVNLALPTPPLNHVPKHHIYVSFKYVQGW